MCNRLVRKSGNTRDCCVLISAMQSETLSYDTKDAEEAQSRRA